MKTAASKTANADKQLGPTPAAASVQPVLPAKQAVSASLDIDSDVKGDYVPCKFTLSQLRNLVVPEASTTLTPADAEKLVQRIIAAAVSQSDEPLRKESPLANFVNSISTEQFVGITPGQALNKVIQHLADFSETNKPGANAATWKESMLAEAATKLKVSSAELKTNHPNLVSTVSTMETGIQEADNKGVSSVSDQGKQKAQTLPNTLTQPEKEAIQGAAATVAENDKLARTDSQKATSIIGAARKSVALLERPDDIGCSMSILSWKETSQAFGHLIANEYIAVQVVVRNMNRDREFVLHDVEFEVNFDPTGRFSRFFSGRDKVIVRALSSAQSSFDPRNITVHTAMGFGQLLAAVAPVYLPFQAPTYASGVYNAAFVPSLDKYWKDLSVDQLNLLNDIGFSSTSSSQSVVPKSGTTMFVTFIPVKPFEEGWWTQKCVEMQYLGTTDDDGHVIKLSHAAYNGADPFTPSADAPFGVDVGRALETCITDTPPKRSERHWYTAWTHKTKDGGILSVPANGQQDDDVDGNMDIFRNAYRAPYKNWSPNAVAVFRELANTVVSGMHIVDETEMKASVTDLKCPKDDSGNLKFSDSGETVTCTVTGKNLDKLAKLRLHNTKSATDLHTVEGEVKVVGDSTSATLTLSAADLHHLPEQVYDVYGVSLNGVETQTPQVIHLDNRPVITGYDPSMLDFSASPATLSLTIQGFHLANVKDISLSDKSGKKVKAGPVTADDSKVTTLFTLTDFTGLSSGDFMVNLLDSQNKVIATASTKPLSISLGAGAGVGAGVAVPKAPGAKAKPSVTRH